KTLVALPGGGTLALVWVVRYGGVARVLFGESPREAYAALATREFRHAALVDLGGLLRGDPHAWQTAETVPAWGEGRALSVNAYVVELLHQKLFKFYDRIDFARLRDRGPAPGPGEADDETVALTCLDLADRDDEIPEPISRLSPRQRRRPLRLSRLLAI